MNNDLATERGSVPRPGTHPAALAGRLAVAFALIRRRRSGSLKD
jgi:hypothetical protein